MSITLRKIRHCVIDYGNVILHGTPTKITPETITIKITSCTGRDSGESYPIMVGAQHTFDRSMIDTYR